MSHCSAPLARLPPTPRLLPQDTSPAAPSAVLTGALTPSRLANHQAVAPAGGGKPGTILPAAPAGRAATAPVLHGGGTAGAAAPDTAPDRDATPPPEHHPPRSPRVLFAAIMHPRIAAKIPGVSWLTACRITGWLWEHVASDNYKQVLAAMAAKEAAAGHALDASEHAAPSVGGVKRPRPMARDG
jgi:hypothetical protein